MTPAANGPDGSADVLGVFDHAVVVAAFKDGLQMQGYTFPSAPE